MTPDVKLLLSADDFARLPEGRFQCELVRGKVLTTPVPEPRFGQICGRISCLLGDYSDEHLLGHVVNGSAVITERSPDTVRRADVAFYSYNLMPPGLLPQGYLESMPELVFQVRWPLDRWSTVLGKVSEYLGAGVDVVCVLDRVTETMQLFRDDEQAEKLERDHELYLPDILGDFRVRVARFFE